jgi:hypothetical protein
MSSVASEALEGQRFERSKAGASVVPVGTLMVGLLVLGCSLALCQAQPADGDPDGAEVLTRGPVHEAFAGIVTYNPEPGVVVSKPPPEVIEEVPPEERPEGDNVAWIPGYWGWDDERDDFLWISGTWRALPPGREWIAGYWGQTSQGFQWTSGYWADSTAREVTYLPPPPQTLEAGPNIVAPSPDYAWTPGCWIWYGGRYAWRPGYWVRCRPDWDWIPPHYVCTPRGYVFIGGFWDYPVHRRGILFAPVYVAPRYYARRGYYYSPSIVINLGVFTDHLFLRPRYHHYYFGDYYAPSYSRVGFYASFNFHSGRHGYDPIYTHQRWQHRQDRDWERRIQTSYQYRRDHESARPPRTWAAQRSLNVQTTESRQNRVEVAARFDQVARRQDGPMRFQPVAREERQQWTQRSQEVQRSREQRRTLETQGGERTAQRPNQIAAPVKAELPRSPIVAKAPNQLGRNESPPRPPESPRPDVKSRAPTTSSRRSEKADRQSPQRQAQPQPETQIQTQPRPAEQERRTQVREPSVEQRSQPGAQPRVNDLPNPPTETPRNRGQEKKAQNESERQAREAAKAQEESQRNAQELQRRAQQESEQRAREASKQKARDVSPPNNRDLDKEAQLESERRARGAAARSQEESRQKAQGLERQAQQESEQRARDAAARAQDESRRNAQALEQKARQEADQRAREAANQAAQQNARERQAQQESERRARESAVRNQEETQRNARGWERRSAERPPTAAPGGQGAPQRNGYNRPPPCPNDKGATQLMCRGPQRENPPGQEKKRSDSP